MASLEINWTNEVEIEVDEPFSSVFAPGVALRATEIVKRQMRGTLTNEHAASSYGQPVLVVDGVAYGRRDIVAGTNDMAGAIVNSAIHERRDETGEMRDMSPAGRMAVAFVIGR